MNFWFNYFVRHFICDVGNGGAMLICNKCGKTMRRGKFCVDCGSELSQFFTIKTDVISDQSIECPICGKMSNKGNFCIYCGMPLKNDNTVSQASAFTVTEPVQTQPTVQVQNNTTKLQCVDCGKIHDKGKFCTSCGGALRPIGEAVNEMQTASQTVPQPEPVAAPAQSQENAAKLRCVDCGKIHDKGKFCTSCGGMLKPIDDPTQNEFAAQTATITETVARENTAKLQCTECGKIHDKGKFCTSCGGSLKPMGTAETSEPSQAAPQPSPAVVSPTSSANIPQAETTTNSTGLICPTCGKLFEKGKFCTVCGTTLVPAETAAPAGEQPLHCSACGKIFQAGKFCTVCGGQLVR